MMMEDEKSGGKRIRGSLKLKVPWGGSIASLLVRCVGKPALDQVEKHQFSNRGSQGLRWAELKREKGRSNDRKGGLVSTGPWKGSK